MVGEITMKTDQNATDYQRVAEAIRYLEENFQNQPELDELAAHLKMSPYHVQRLFTRWAGISPKRFLQYLTAEYAKNLLEESKSILDTSYDAGLSSPSRLHDLFVTVEAMTPGEYKAGGAGLEIAYGRHTTPFGDCLLATTERGICALSFVNGQGWEGAISDLHGRWPAASLEERPEETLVLANQIFETTNDSQRPTLRLLLKGTNFQIKVWEALLRIPMGAICSYSDIASTIDRPKAVRAVGSAVGANALAYLIPCHRVIRQNALISDYRWGTARKKAILGWEAARRERQYAGLM
jgi:AraC family transcriptional regulator of adaptative response/methylated-DNA-[protein]-cysteine methyltransferase